MRGADRSVLLVVGLLAAVAAVLWLLDPWSSEGPRHGAPASGDAVSAEPARAEASGEAAPPRASAAGERVEVPASVASSAGAPGPQELWGRVVAVGAGTPIALADVRLQHRDADEFWNLDLDYGARIDELDRTASDADGRFRFAVARARAHRLHVSADGYAAATVLCCIGGSEVVVELARGASIDGAVVCAGAGVPDAAVRIGVRGESVELAVVRTGRDGVFRSLGCPRPACTCRRARRGTTRCGSASTCRPVRRTGSRSRSSRGGASAGG